MLANYGMMAFLTIFIAILQVLGDSGFGELYGRCDSGQLQSNLLAASDITA